jgi:hypothetical protein
MMADFQARTPGSLLASSRKRRKKRGSAVKDKMCRARGELRRQRILTRAPKNPRAPRVQR